MKRIYLFIFILFIGGLASAEKFSNQPNVNDHSSEAIAISSCSCADNSNGGSVLISTYPSELFIVNITSPGVGTDPVVQLYDAANTTTNVRQLTSPIAAKTIQQMFFDITTTSGGISARNLGGACVTYTYREK